MRSTRWLIVSLVSLLAACGGGSGTPDAFPAPQCSDHQDNDGDGMVDFPDDLGCTNANDESEDSLPMPQCADGRDNDGDGHFDYPDDPGCIATQQDDETDDCPDGPACPQCGNGKDDDGNGATDYSGSDPGCTSASDNDEFVHNPAACGGTALAVSLPTTDEAMGMFDTTKTTTTPLACGLTTAGAMAAVYELYLTKPQVVEVSTDDASTTADTVIDIRTASCTGADAEIACHDDVTSTNKKSKVTVSLTPGLYYILLGSKTSAGGNYKLTVKRYAGEGTDCTAAECGPGLVCRIPLGQTAMVCSKPMCSDGVDDDGDTKNDFPNDPGCFSAADNDETDTCPGVGPGCPACGDGIDNDGDAKIDYPMDPECASAASDLENRCTMDTDPQTVVTTTPITGTTVGATNNFASTTCISSSGPDVVYGLQLPVPVASLVVDTIGSPFDTVLQIRDTTCGTQISCDDQGGGSNTSKITQTNVAAGTYFIVVDGWLGASGTFTLNIKGKVAAGVACTSPLFASGVLACNTGLACTAGTCQ